jgi:hypothetical protein
VKKGGVKLLDPKEIAPHFLPMLTNSPSLPLPKSLLSDLSASANDQPSESFMDAFAAPAAQAGHVNESLVIAQAGASIERELPPFLPSKVHARVCVCVCVPQVSEAMRESITEKIERLCDGAFVTRSM